MNKPDLDSALSGIILTNGERAAIEKAAGDLQSLLDGFPVLGSVALSLVRSE